MLIPTDYLLSPKSIYYIFMTGLDFILYTFPKKKQSITLKYFLIMINTLPQLSFIFDRRKVASSTKKSSLEIRITHNYKQKYINTGIKLYPNQWKNGKIVNCPDALQISQTLDKLIKDIRQILLNMLEEGEIDIYSISSRLVKIKEGKMSFLDFCRQRLTIRKYGKALGSQWKSRACLTPEGKRC